MALEDNSGSKKKFPRESKEKMKREKMEIKAKDFEDQSGSFHIYLEDIPIRRQNGREGIMQILINRSEVEPEVVFSFLFF